MPPEELLKRKTAKAASELAQAEPVFDDEGVFGGETRNKAERSDEAAIAFAPPNGIQRISLQNADSDG